MYELWLQTPGANYAMFIGAGRAEWHPLRPAPEHRAADASRPLRARGAKVDARLRARWPSVQPVHTPLHASWLNQIKIDCSVVQRKVLTPDESDAHRAGTLRCWPSTPLSGDGATVSLDVSCGRTCAHLLRGGDPGQGIVCRFCQHGFNGSTRPTPLARK